MNILKFAEKIYSNQQLNKLQKALLLHYQRAKEENKILFVSFGRNNGRTMIKKIIDEFNNQ